MPGRRDAAGQTLRHTEGGVKKEKKKKGGGRGGRPRNLSLRQRLPCFYVLEMTLAGTQKERKKGKGRKTKGYSLSSLAVGCFFFLKSRESWAIHSGGVVAYQGEGKKRGKKGKDESVASLRLKDPWRLAFHELRKKGKEGEKEDEPIHSPAPFL